MTEHRQICIRLNGKDFFVPDGVTVAAALVSAGSRQTRWSVRGLPRFAVCGMGICQECRVTVNGEAHQLACQMLCEEGMQIRTQDPV